MAASSAIIGKGTTLSYSATQGGSYTALSEVTDVSLPTVKIGKVDVTHYLSDNNTMEYKSAVWQDHEDIKLTLNFLKAQTTTLESFVGVDKWWKITLPDGSTYVQPGFISELGGAAPNKDKVSQSVSITPTGPHTFAAAS